MGLPNLITLARMGLVPLFIISVLQGSPVKALVVFAAAGASDALDGFIARVFDQQTAIGATLDPIADKLLLASAYVVLAVPGMWPGVAIPVWITVLVIGRDVLILTVALVLSVVADVGGFRPSLLSKINTAMQIVAVCLVLGSGVTAGLGPWALVALHLVAALTIASGLGYLARAHRLAEDREQP